MLIQITDNMQALTRLIMLGVGANIRPGDTVNVNDELGQLLVMEGIGTVVQTKADSARLNKEFKAEIKGKAAARAKSTAKSAAKSKSKAKPKPAKSEPDEKPKRTRRKSTNRKKKKSTKL